jgi:integrase
LFSVFNDGLLTNPATVFAHATGQEADSDQGAVQVTRSMNFADFVQFRFVPEFVANKRPSGQAHYRAILKHVLTPEKAVRAFAAGPRGKLRLKTIAGWPYFDSYALAGIDAERIQHLTSEALKRGYSIQTVKHIRNVISVIFSYAIDTGAYAGTNPATRVTLPAMARREVRSLTASQLEQVLQVMHHPERELALLALLTELNVAEGCGLQWKYVNLSGDTQFVEGELLPPWMIAVRKQSYRGKCGPVMASRRRFITVPELLLPTLRDLKGRRTYTGPEDFVLVTRNGTPVYHENLAARRLKRIGKAFGMPWLSWYVFHRTRASVNSHLDRNLNSEFERILRRARSRISLGSV